MKKQVTLALLILSSAILTTQARIRHFIFDDMSEEFERMHERMAHLNREFWTSFSMPTVQIDTKQAEAIKKARKNLAQIKPEITHDDNSVTVTFSLHNADKKAIDIAVEDAVLNGTIPTSDGKVEFAVTNNYLEIARRIEIKKEDTTKEKQATVHYGSLATKVTLLPQVVDVSTVKATTKDDKLVLVFGKKKQAKIAIAHS